jgi:hypothetical protein
MTTLIDTDGLIDDHRQAAKSLASTFAFREVLDAILQPVDQIAQHQDQLADACQLARKLTGTCAECVTRMTRMMRICASCSGRGIGRERHVMLLSKWQQLVPSDVFRVQQQFNRPHNVS